MPFPDFQAFFGALHDCYFFLHFHCAFVCFVLYLALVLGKLGPGQSGPGQLGPGQLGPGQLGPGARLFGAQLSAPQKWQIGPQTVEWGLWHQVAPPNLYQLFSCSNWSII